MPSDNPKPNPPIQPGGNPSPFPAPPPGPTPCATLENAAVPRAGHETDEPETDDL